jgi:hypothetical protein
VRRIVLNRLAVAATVALTLLGGPLLPAAAAPMAGQGEATPVSARGDAGSLAAMLGHLPDRPLGLEGAMVVYVDVAAQAAALGVDLPPGDDEASLGGWIAAASSLMFPQATGDRWHLPEWRETFGFDVFQVEQAAEYAAPPFAVTVVRGSFDPAELRAAWTRGGYQPIDLGAGEAYAVRDDYEIAMSDPGSRMALAYFNVVALADDGTLIFGSERGGVGQALAAAAGEGPSFAQRPDVAPVVRAAPADLVSALLVDGASLQAIPDPAEAMLGAESPAAFATRVAAEQIEARRLPPVGTALLGQTAGAFPDAPEGASATEMPTMLASQAAEAQLVVALTTLTPALAGEAAAVLALRLETQRPPASMRESLAGRDWIELFPERTVQAVPGEAAVLIELTPAPGVSPRILVEMLFRRDLGFLAWSL